MHYQPQCQSTFVSYMDFICSFFFLSCTHFTALSILFCIHVSLCITYMFSCLCVFMTACVSVSVIVPVFAHMMACLCVDASSEITGCWVALSLGSLVSFGPSAPSNAQWSDEIWQMGTKDPIPYYSLNSDIRCGSGDFLQAHAHNWIRKSRHATSYFNNNLSNFVHFLMINCNAYNTDMTLSIAHLHHVAWFTAEA